MSNHFFSALEIKQITNVKLFLVEFDDKGGHELKEGSLIDRKRFIRFHHSNTMNCYYHPERASVAQCVACGKNLCSECVTTKDGRNYCKECLRTGEIQIEIEKIVIPALACGVLAGILSVIPILSLLNCFFCLWIIIGGGLAVYLVKYLNNIRGKLTVGTAALTGGLTGLVAGIVRAVAALFLGTLLYSLMKDTAFEFPDIFTDTGFLYSPFGALVAFATLVTIFLYVIFGALGGIISNEITK